MSIAYPVAAKKLAAHSVKVCCIAIFSFFIPMTMGTEALAAEQPAAIIRQISFANDLKTGELKFNGTEFTRIINFPFPSTCQSVSGSKLHLRLKHAAELLPKYSTLTVAINDHLVQTIPINHSNYDNQWQTVNLDNVRFKEWNKLTLTARQHYTMECEDQLSPRLWSLIDSHSFLELAYRYRDTINLSNWPAPLADKKLLGVGKIAFQIPKHPSLETIRAISLLAFKLGAHGSNKIVSSKEAEAIIDVGTPSELSNVSPLTANKVCAYTNDLFTGNDGKPLRRHNGVVYANIIDEKPHFTVSANSPEGVYNAAHALVDPAFAPMLASNIAVIDESHWPEREPKPAQLKDLSVIPEDGYFTLKQLGFETTTVRGSHASSLYISANTLPGVQYIGGVHTLKVAFGYSANLDPSRSRLEIKLNGETIRTYKLVNPNGEPLKIDEVDIAANALKDKNVLEFHFILIPRGLAPCVPLIDQELWGTLYDWSGCYLDRQYATTLPNLALLQFSWFPFVRNLANSQISIVVPSHCTPATIKVLSQLCVELGASSNGSTDAPKVFFDNTGLDRKSNEGDVIIISGLPRNRLLTTYEDKFHLNSNAIAQFSRVPKSELTACGYLEEIRSPINPSQIWLLIQGDSQASLLRAANGLFEKKSNLAGTEAVITAGGNIFTAQTSPVGRYRATSVSRQSAMVISTHPWLATIAICLAALLLMFGLRRWISQMQRAQNTVT